MKARAQRNEADGPEACVEPLLGGAPGHNLKDLARAVGNRSKYFRRELKRCQRKFSEKAIHRSRVEARRLLSSLDLLGVLISARHLRKAQRALKRHLDSFDDLRDTQVQLLVVDKMLRFYPAARPFHQFLLKREKRFRRKTSQCISRLHHRRLRRVMAACRQDIRAHLPDHPPKPAAEVLLCAADSAFGRTKRRWARIRPGDVGAIHRTRVAFKRFRYMVEALADFLPGVTDEHLTAMGHYQTMMGEIQDADVLVRTLDKFLRKQQIKSAAARHFRDELLRRRQWLIQVYLDAAKQLLEFWPLPECRAAAAPAGCGRLARTH